MASGALTLLCSVRKRLSAAGLSKSAFWSSKFSFPEVREEILLTPVLRLTQACSPRERGTPGSPAALPVAGLSDGKALS